MDSPLKRDFGYVFSKLTNTSRVPILAMEKFVFRKRLLEKEMRKTKEARRACVGLAVRRQSGSYFGGRTMTLLRSRRPDNAGRTAS
jgi:hypothetical protein